MEINYQILFEELEKDLYESPNLFKSRLEKALKQGYPINYRNTQVDYDINREDGDSILHQAVKCILKQDKHLEIALRNIQVVLDAGADPNIANARKTIPLDYAVSWYLPREVVDMLVKAGTKINEGMHSDLFSKICETAMCHGKEMHYAFHDFEADEEDVISCSEDLERVKEWLELGINPLGSWTPARYNSRRYLYDPEMLSFKQDEGQLETIDYYYPECVETALEILSYIREISLPMGLKGVTEEALAYHELCCLVVLDTERFKARLEDALAKGFCIDYVPEGEVMTILGVACMYDRPKIENIKLLLENGADPNSPNPEKCAFANLSYNYIYSGYPNILTITKALQLLENYRVDIGNIDVTPEKHKRHMTAARYIKNLENFRYLTEAIDNLEKFKKRYAKAVLDGYFVNFLPAGARNTLLQKSVLPGCSTEPEHDVLSFLLDNGADIDAAPRNISENLLVSCALWSPSPQRLKRLLEAGYDIESQGCFSETAFIALCKKYIERDWSMLGGAEKILDSISFLISAGAKPDYSWSKRDNCFRDEEEEQRIKSLLSYIQTYIAMKDKAGTDYEYEL